jgi:CDP-Glycerol:Poly(glycerophosphate) glycerophosphotransferase
MSSGVHINRNPLWKGLRKRLWQLAHLHLYKAEIVAWIWSNFTQMRIRLGRWRGTKHLLFHITNSGQYNYIEPVLRKLQQSGGKLSCYLACDAATKSAIFRNSLIPGINSRELTVCRRLRGFDAVISPTLWSDVHSLAPVRICMFHGQPTKGNSFPRERMEVFNHLFLLGPFQRNLYEMTVAGNLGWATSIQTHNIGYPKSDDLMAHRFERSRILGDLGLDPSKPTLIYAPAFDKGTSLDQYGETIFEALVRLDANILVKLHPVNYERALAPQHSNGIYWPDILKKYEDCPNFRHVGNQPLDPFMAASDIMVTDVSGAALEFMLLDRPVLFIDCPEFFTQTLSGNQYYPRKGEVVMQDIHANAGRSAGSIVHSMEEIPAAVRNSLDHPEEFSDARCTIRDMLLYNPGHAAEAAAQKIMDLLGQIEQEL